MLLLRLLLLVLVTRLSTWCIGGTGSIGQHGRRLVKLSNWTLPARSRALRDPPNEAFDRAQPLATLILVLPIRRREFRHVVGGRSGAELAEVGLSGL